MAIGLTKSNVPTLLPVLTTNDLWDRKKNPDGALVKRDEMKLVLLDYMNREIKIYDTKSEAEAYIESNREAIKKGDEFYIRNENDIAYQWWWDGQTLVPGKRDIDLTEWTKATLAKSKEYTDQKISTVQSTLTFDTVPTENSTNPVTSNGIYTAIKSLSDIVGQANALLEATL